MDLSDDFINDFDSNDFDPEPSEGKNRTRLIIGAVAIVLLCCCSSFLYAGWTFGDRVLELLGIL
jgi:hypothetical protein